MRVVCEPIGPVAVGDPAIVRVTSVNDGERAVDWPIRLHPSESTISFVVDGEPRQGVEQIDSIVETVTLEPGDAVSTGVAVPLDDGAGEFELRLAVRPPGAGDEVLSNLCRIVVQPSGTAVDEAAAPLTTLDQLAWSVRNGEGTDHEAVSTALESFAEQKRPWIATALLPAAPSSDDVLLVAATSLLADRRAGADESSAPAWARIADAVLAGRPHRP